MSLNLTAGVARVAKLGVAAGAALAIVQETINLIDAAEQLYAELKGSEKFAAVEAGVRTLVEDLGLADKFEAIWKALGPFVSLVVTVFNLRGLWPHQQPAASPLAAP